MTDSPFCPCGVTLMGDPDEDNGLCATCAAAPHDRECACDECEDYWARVIAESTAAAEAFNQRLVCSCGWTGPFIEHHRDRLPGCVVTGR